MLLSFSGIMISFPRPPLLLALLPLLLSSCAPPSLLNARHPEDPARRLAASLRLGSQAEQLAAARAMGRVRDARFAPELIKALTHPDPFVRREAAFSLGQLRIDEAGEPPPELTHALLNALGDKDEAARAAAAEALGKSGGEGVEEHLAQALSDADQNLRREAALALFRLRYLERIPSYSTGTLNALLRGFEDPDPGTRWRCVYAFSRRPEPRAQAHLLKAASQADPLVRLFALRALSKIEGEAAAGIARTALSDPDERVRVEVLSFLKRAGPELLPPSLERDPSPHVRAAAASALEDARGDLDLLRALARDEAPLVRGQAILSLAERLKEESSPDVAAALSDAHPWVRSRAALAAARLTRPLPILETTLNDPDLNVRSAAVEAFGLLPEASALGRILAILEDPVSPPELLGPAVDAVAAWKSTAALSALTQTRRNTRGREFTEVREGMVAAAQALAEVSPKAPGLMALRASFLSDPAPSVREKAARSLGLARRPEPIGEDALRVERPLASKAAALVLETASGEIEISLDAGQAPVHVSSILAAARRGVYDGTPWHRVVSNFVVQGGDPRGTGWGDAGYFLQDEINPLKFEEGSVGMPKAGRDTGGCQLFITVVPAPHLDGRYTALGHVTRGMDIVRRLQPGDRILKARAQERPAP